MNKALHDAVAGLMRDTAEAIVLPRFRHLAAADIEEKSPGELVTIADRECEAALSEGLSRILPEAAVIGEEACAADPALIKELGKGLAWIIDPIDGTSNFASGKAPFALMIALVEGDATLAGWIYDPLTGRLCSAARGEGAFINDEPVSARASGAALPVAGISTLFMDAATREAFLARADGRMMLADIPRCAGEQYPRIVLGGHDLALYERTLAWDHVPGVLFLEEAGGKAARLDGSAYRFAIEGSGLLAAGSPAMWDQAANILNGADCLLQ